MKEFKVIVPNGIRLQWFGDSVEQIRKEAEFEGHRVLSVRFHQKTSNGAESWLEEQRFQETETIGS